jgi:hypothetical protein
MRHGRFSLSRSATIAGLMLDSGLRIAIQPHHDLFDFVTNPHYHPHPDFPQESRR